MIELSHLYGETYSTRGRMLIKSEEHVAKSIFALYDESEELPLLDQLRSFLQGYRTRIAIAYADKDYNVTSREGKWFSGIQYNGTSLSAISAAKETIGLSQLDIIEPGTWWAMHQCYIYFNILDLRNNAATILGNQPADDTFFLWLPEGVQPPEIMPLYATGLLTNKGKFKWYKVLSTPTGNLARELKRQQAQEIKDKVYESSLNTTQDVSSLQAELVQLKQQVAELLKGSRSFDSVSDKGAK